MKNNDIEYDIKLTKESLENGLTFYIYKDSSNKGEARVALIVKVGSLMEDSDEMGISHFTEHFCIYNANCSDDEENQTMNSLYGYTKLMETVYLKKTKTENLIENLLVLKNILIGKNFSKIGIEKVRADLVDEISRVTSKANYKLKEIILPKILKINNLKNKLPIGKLENINRLDYDSIMSFYNKWYEPKNSAILIAGDIGNYDLKPFIQKNFSGIKNNKQELKRLTFNKAENLKGKEILINTFNDLEEDEIQFYYPKVALKYESKSDLERKISEYFELNFIQQYVCSMFRKVDINYSKIDFVSQRLIKDFNYNVLQLKVNSNLSEKLEFIIETIKKLVLTGVSEEEFDFYKEEFFQGLREQYDSSEMPDTKLIIQECIDNYLYNEPIMSLRQEYDICNSVAKNIKLSQFNIEISNLLRSVDVLIAINCKTDQHINKNNISRLTNFI